MDIVRTRSASLNDLPVLEDFLQMLVEVERAFDETLQNGRIVYYSLKELIESDDSELVVLEKGSSIVGCGYVQIRKAEHFLIHEKYAHLGFMFILPEYRGIGLNQQLITELKNWALSKGIKEVRLEVYEENTSAVKAYEKAGFKKLLSTMRCEIK